VIYGRHRQFKAAWERFAGDEANLVEFLNASGGALALLESRHIG
jgi:hypothetical protein